MIIATKSVTINQPNGKQIKLFKGVEVKKSVYNKLSPRQIETYTVKQTKTRNTWTYDEINYMAILYHTLTDPSVNGENAQEIVASFRERYTTHTDAAIIMMIAQCKALDSLYDAVGLNYNSHLVTVLTTLDPDRYGV